MVDIQQEESEDLSFVIDSGKEVDSNSSEVLDLSCKHTTPSSESTKGLPPTSCIPSSEMDNQQLIQQPNISNTPLVPLNLHMDIGTAERTKNQKLSQKRKKLSDNNDETNYQINDVQINSNQMLHKPLDRNYNISVNQANQTKDINSNTNYGSNLLLIGSSILQQHSITKPIGVEFLPINNISHNNISVPNIPPLPLPAIMSKEEKEKSSMLTSITKAPRPFKVYPKDPLVLSTGDKNNFDEYKSFRNNLLQQVSHETGNTNTKMRRISNGSNSSTNSPDDDEKNRAYLEKRKKNNAAAKRSRDARRAKEDEIAIRAAFLEHENFTLKRTVEFIAKQMQEKNIPFDFGPIIEMNENILGLNTVHKSS